MAEEASATYEAIKSAIYAEPMSPYVGRFMLSELQSAGSNLVLRDYILQLVPDYLLATRGTHEEASCEAKLLAFLWDIVRRDAGSGAGTALLSLSRLSEAGRLVEKHDVVKEARNLCLGKNAEISTKGTALGVLQRLSEQDFHDVRRHMSGGRPAGAFMEACSKSKTAL